MSKEQYPKELRVEAIDQLTDAVIKLDVTKLNELKDDLLRRGFDHETVEDYTQISMNLVDEVESSRGSTRE